MKDASKDAHKTDLKALYKKLDGDKKLVKLKALEFILEGNRTVGLDDILVREGFQSFPAKTQFESKRSLAHFEAFFEYMSSHGEEIEAKYLQQSSDSELMKEASTSDPHNYNFLLNKNSVSKFIRDEATHYQRIIDAYLESAPDADRGIPTKKVSAFMAELFNSSHSAVLLDGKPYFGRAEVATELGGLLADFGVKAKGLSGEEAKKPFMIEEEEMLDFLTHWLKESSTLNLYVLYARTTSRLQKEVAFLANSQQQQQQPIHPSRMTNEDFIAAQIAAEAAPPLTAAVSKQVNQQAEEGKLTANIESSLSGQGDITVSKEEVVEQAMKGNGEKSQDLGNGVDKGKKIEAGGKSEKVEGWRRELKGLFEFGCKRRYKFSRLSTFEDIQLSTRTMDLQKFVYFCNFFELLDLMTRELITEYFRMQATDRLIDYPRFVIIMEKLVSINPKVGQRLQNKGEFEGKLKLSHIRKDKKMDRLSEYKFAIRPINGKDVSSIQKELDFRRLEKAIARQEKEKSTLNVRQPSSRLQLKNNRVSKLSLAELEPIRDSGFNPEKLMVADSQHDHLWEAYEAKIWKREETAGSALQTILAKRMERGAQIITKMNSQRSFMQD